MGLLDSLKATFARILGRKPNTTANAVPPSAEAAMADLARAQDAFRNHAEILTQQLVAGILSPAEWRTQMEQEIRYLHVTAQAIGKGGFANMDSGDLRIAGNAVEQQLTYLDRWVNSMVLPTGINESYAIARAKMYAGAATATMNSARMQVLGLLLPQVPGDGHTECLSNCKCHLDIVKLDGNGNFDVAWRVDLVAEHCPDCIDLSERWRPLRIRNGQIT